MKELLSLLNSICPLSLALQQYLSATLKSKTITRRDHLLTAGNICRHIYFVKKGLFRCYYFEAGHEVSSKFMKEGDILVSAASFFLQQYSNEYVQALEDAVVWYICYDELQYIYKTFPEFNTIAATLTTKSYLLSENRAKLIRMKNGTERYYYMLQHHPDLVLRVPAKYLATYLCVTEETLSRIRAKRS
ncbi:CRP-like cAMP-binding protein [Lacibacter cauensis]|uniref:CRP-like cAMP-binding protein n=1 Tax=Lacibacter cauensis TaxID=510947 RepID=A0A562SPU0_9BACT|nr:Crp/Fnr family transcriptional regulator [Lacibacter cauensis]TWI83252.1 CRP-like cAMP-binding protein [Lacibacter cauensis]